jgi:hypothetical protein
MHILSIDVAAVGRLDFLESESIIIIMTPEKKAADTFLGRRSYYGNDVDRTRTIYV